VLVWALWARLGRRLLTGSLVFALAVTVFLSIYRTPWKELESPVDAAILNSAGDALHLHSGLANYWISTPLSFHSRFFLADLTSNGYLMCKLTSLSWLGIEGTPGNPRRYDFLITHDIDPEAALGLYGPPSRICKIYFEKFGTSLWIYNRNLGDLLPRDTFYIGFLALKAQRTGYLLPPNDLMALKHTLGGLAAKGPIYYHRVK
jgi:hypothetical protein